MLNSKTRNDKNKEVAERKTPKIKKDTKNFVGKTMKLSTAAFSLVAALAWNEFVKTLVSTYIKKGKDVWSLLIYALLMTFVAVFVSTRAENVERKLGVKKRKK